MIPVLLGARPHIVDGVIEVSGGIFERGIARLPARFHFGAITFGHVIIGLMPGTLDHCREHEHVHVRQYERWGTLFFPLYAAFSLHAWMRGARPYRDNRFERQAYEATRKV